jgi:UPF0271 protein
VTQIALEAFGDAAVRVRLSDDADALALRDALKALPRVIDVVVTEQYALVTFDPESPPDGLDAALRDSLTKPQSRDFVRTPPRVKPPSAHVVQVRYDGPDLQDVARAVGMTEREVISRHSERDYVVSAVGFLPGFAYLRGLDPRLAIPRLPSPRPRVAPLSVGIAGPYTGIYPFASPGGWHLVGTAAGFAPFDAHAGALLALGDRVRFVESEQ